jgi:hypothetical protein
MGLDRSFAKFIDDTIKTHFQSTNKLKMLELGDQIFWEKGKPISLTGKKYFSDMGIDHVSVDLNGLNESVIKDLRNPQDFTEFKNKFDIITNAGTTEHVEPFESQIVCYGILHDCLKVNGLFIHILPDASEVDGMWKNHCKFYYSLELFTNMASEFNYQILKTEMIRGNICVGMIKKEDSKFNLESEIFKKFLLVR